MSADLPTVPAHLLPHRTPAKLLAAARQQLSEAAETRPPGLRYAAAHLAALRAAAAVLAAAASRPAVTNRQERHRVPGVWVQLAQVAPELDGWAAHFAGTSSRRAACEAGIPRVVSGQDADDMLRAAGEFVDLVDRELGGLYVVPWVKPVPDHAPGHGKAAKR
ncbi:SAV_6107 family HEPN domain-containing protein [Verrucosispora sp. WMMC514]|uniref:SAV_6107 family HEPN domain-containing protein n=1 Tax=Verrucosispora sp. WMMC514 TaxID=3015156 RepID=UPI00248D0267|nr:SAV_6107 family HEPN domain-containing protein [Verrucosispora sp. WMMC514]WBB94111.1 SAV_6107 family HEPN domain-containing protein [Verrucosispora sp. WMMC514]